MSITTAQIRGARGILNWSQADLSQRTGISATSIGSIENGATTPRASTLDKIRSAFESAGIEFLGLEGVRQRTGDVRIFLGQTGFVDFFELVYSSVKEAGGEVLVSNVEEKKFLKWAGESAESHIVRMSELKGKVKYRVLLREGDYNFVASEYAEYRWIPTEYFSSVPFYVFCDKLAIFLFDGTPTIVLLDYPAVADAYSRQFRSIWDKSIIPDMSKQRLLG